MDELQRLHRTEVLQGASADVTAQRERARLRRVGRLTVGVWVLCAWLVYRTMFSESWLPQFPLLSGQNGPSLLIVGLLGVVVLLPMLAAGRSPHVLYRPDEIDVGLDDVVGSDVVREEVVRTLNLFLAHETLRDQLGATPRRGVLFEGPPGTGKTHIAKAMAKEASVPFLFVSSSAFQSMYYGQTNRKVRAYFRALRKAARHEGGAIGFIEEIDAIGGARAGMGGGRGEGVSGVVNELLIQLQSFDEPTTSMRIKGWFVERLNSLLSDGDRHRKPRGEIANVLIVAATNRADDLDPALLRPGRFDRTIHFDVPARFERRALIDHFLNHKAHTAAVDDDGVRDQLAAATAGYSPVMIEHLLDEALVWALRRGAGELDEGDILKAKLTEELGLQHPVAYTDHERLAVATHEAGHATLAYLCGRTTDPDKIEPDEPIRRLEVLSIIKRRGSLGVLSHTDDEEHFTKSRAELLSLIRIAFGGMVAEELEFGESGTSPSSDLASATTLAAQMVGALGMGGSLVSLEAANSPTAGDLVAKVISDDKSRDALERILDGAKTDAERLLRQHRPIHLALRDALLEREELVGDEILDVISAAVAAEAFKEIDLRDHTSELH